MTSSSPETAPLTTTSKRPARPARTPGVSAYTTDEGIVVQIDEHITASEFSQGLALLVPASARLGRTEADEDGGAELLFVLPGRL